MYMNILLGWDRVGLIHLHYDKFGILPDMNMGHLKQIKINLTGCFYSSELESTYNLIPRCLSSFLASTSSGFNAPVSNFLNRAALSFIRFANCSCVKPFSCEPALLALKNQRQVWYRRSSESYEQYNDFYLYQACCWRGIDFDSY